MSLLVNNESDDDNVVNTLSFGFGSLTRSFRNSDNNQNQNSPTRTRPPKKAPGRFGYFSNFNEKPTSVSIK